MDLGKQIGPLPLGAWIAVVGVGLGIAYYTRNSGGDPVEVEDGSSPDGVGDGSVGGWVPTSPAAGGGDVAPIDLSTNDAWGQAAINFLIAEKYNPTQAEQAIRKYLAGGSLSVSETALVGRALMKYGAPPTPLPPTTEDPGTGGGTTTPPAPTPTGYRGYGWYKANGREDSSAIAKKYKLTLVQYYAYNPSLPRVPKAGTWVKVRLNSNPLSGYKGT